MAGNETFHDLQSNEPDYSYCSSDDSLDGHGPYAYMTQPPAGWSCDPLCVFILMSSIIIFILGVLGNGLVIWIIGLKTRRTVNSSWYLSLAVSDLLLCITLPFNSVYMTTGEWHFGHFLCKFIRVAIHLNVYGSVFLLVIISVDRCICVIAPVWSQNHRTLRGSSVVIIVAWILSAMIALPILIFSTTQKNDKTHCTCTYNNTLAPMSLKTLIVTGFVFGLAVPLVVIVVCYAIIMQKLRADRISKSSKPFRLMTAVIITFVICWLPFQIFRMLEIYQVPNIDTGQEIAIILAYANSFMNPVLYTFMGHDFRNKCIRSICARMENALQEDGMSAKPMSSSRSADI